MNTPYDTLAHCGFFIGQSLQTLFSGLLCSALSTLRSSGLAILDHVPDAPPSPSLSLSPRTTTATSSDDLLPLTTSRCCGLDR